MTWCYHSPPLLPLPRTSSTVSLVIENYSGQVIKNLRFLKAKVQLQDKSAPVTFYVTERCSSLLGLDAIKDLKIVIMGEILSCAQVASSSVRPNTPLEFRHLFTPGLGLVTGYIHRVKRRPEVNPVSSKLRRLPLLLRQKVADELVRLEATRVDASDWVSPMVVVKKDDSIMLGVDLHEPNKAILVNGFPLPQHE